MVDATLEHFPQHLAHFNLKNAAMTQVRPPIITTLYSDFPAMQAEIDVARKRIAHLENRMLNNSTFQNHKRKEPPGSWYRLTRSQSTLVGAENSKRTPKISISNRPDIPDGCIPCYIMFEPRRLPKLSLKAHTWL